MDIYIRRTPEGRGNELKGDGGRAGTGQAVRVFGFEVVLYHIIAILIFLFLLQSYKETVSSIYYYNLVAMGLTTSVSIILVFLVPSFIRYPVKRLGWRTTFIILGAVTATARLPMGFGLEQPYHLIFSTVTLVSSSLMFALLLALHRREREVDGDLFSSHSITASFSLALMLMVIMRGLGSGLDISIVPGAMGATLAPGISGVLCLGFGFLIYGLRGSHLLDRTRRGDEEPGYTISGGGADSWLPALGLGAFLMVSSGILIDPHVVSGWTGEEFTTALSFTVLSMGLFVFSLLSGMSWLLALRRGFSSPFGSILGGLVLVAGGVNLFFLKLNTGVIPGAFVWMALVDLWLIMDALSDPAPFAGEPMEIRRSDGSVKVIGFPGKRRKRASPGHFGKIVSIALGLGFLHVVLISFSLNWSFLPLGSIFKGGIPVFMLASVALLAFSGFSCSKKKLEEPALTLQRPNVKTRGSPTLDAAEGSSRLRRIRMGSKRLKGLFLTLGSFCMVFILLSGASTLFLYNLDVDSSPLEAGETLTVVTYNIHHGYSNDGRVDPTPHLRELERLKPDIVFLQEADSLLINQGNFDPGAYLARNLEMYYLRGSDPGLGNPGTAILSRFPLDEIRIFKLHSTDIQRIAVTCRANLGSMDLFLINLHMGLEEEERTRQFGDLFNIISGFGNSSMIVGGDLNTQPDEEMMAPLNPEIFGNGAGLNTSSYSFRSAWHSTEKGREDPFHPTFPAEGLDLEREHIDYILCTPDMEVVDAGIEPGAGASDHRPVWAIFRI